MTVNWNFFGSATQKSMSVASVVATAMECHQTTSMTSEVLSMACEMLDCEWDRASILAVLDSCIFEEVVSC